MLVKSLLLFVAAIVAAAASGSDSAPQNVVAAPAVCPECQPCGINCLCSDNHRSTCDSKPPVPPRNPDGVPVCAENQPCQSDCLCPLAFEKQPTGNQPKGHHHLDVTVCAEGQPCSECDLCSLDIVLTYLNPAKLSGSTKVCDVGVCNATCVCRETLLDSMKSVLFPPKGTKVIDFSPDDQSADVKEEL